MARYCYRPALVAFLFLGGLASGDVAAKAGDAIIDGSLGVGVDSPGQRLHVGDGNILIEGGGETAIIIKRDVVIIEGVSGTSSNPIFQVGRIVAAGDGDPELRVLYADDANPVAASVFELDRKGIVASVKPQAGSHFEGFIRGDTEPLFRLNSFPSMQLEMGPGGEAPTDVFIRRDEDEGNPVLAFFIGGSEQARIDSTGDVGIGLVDPQAKLDVAGSVAADGFITHLSDSRAKRDIQPITGALERVARLRGVEFLWKDEPEEGIQVGVIAQEVEKEFPSLVVTNRAGLKGVRYSGLIAPLIEAVRELKAQNEELRALLCLEHPDAPTC